MWTNKDVSKKSGILVLCSGIYPHSTGGAEVHLFYMCRKLAERGHPVFVISPARARLVKLWSKPFAILSYIVKSFVESFKLRKQIDIVHAAPADYPMTSAFVFALFSHKPYIVTCMGSDIRMFSRKFLRRAFQLPFLRDAKIIVTVSKQIAELLTQKYGIPKRKIVVIGNAYDDRITRELANIRLYDDTQKSKRIISVANLRPEKDHITLLKGFARLVKKMNNVQLSLVGKGPLRGQLEEFCIQHNLHSVRFLGRLTHEDALEHIANSDIFILTSVEEGMPTVILEALALGKPVIATAVGGIPEVVKDGINGILIPSRSPRHVAVALERTLTDSELWRKLGKAAAESVKSLSWSKIAEKYERVYKIVLSSEGD